MTRYLDSSIIVSALTIEARTAQARAILNNISSVVASGWTMVEAASALSIKMRTEAITEAEHVEAMRRLHMIESNYLPLLAVTETHLHHAMRHAGRPELNLRGGDALHIAIAASADATLITGDVGMSRAAERLGVAVRLLA